MTCLRPARRRRAGFIPATDLMAGYAFVLGWHRAYDRVAYIDIFFWVAKTGQA